MTWILKDESEAVVALTRAHSAMVEAERDFCAAVAVARDAGVTWDVVSRVRGVGTRQASMHWARRAVPPVDVLPVELVRRWRRKLRVVERATAFVVVTPDGTIRSHHRSLDAARRACRDFERIETQDVHGRQARLRL